MVNNPFSSSDEYEEHIQKTINEVNESLKIEKQEAQLDEEIENDLAEILEDFEEMSGVIHQLSSDGGLSKWDYAKLSGQQIRRFEEDAEEIRNDLDEIIQDIARKQRDMEQDEKLEEDVGNQIKNLKENLLNPLNQAIKQMEAAKEESMS